MAVDLLTALALLLILEGLLPALNPSGWRGMVEQIGQLPDRTIRIGGIVLVIVGALLFHFARAML